MDTRQENELTNAACNLPPPPVSTTIRHGLQNVANPENNSTLHASMSMDSQKRDAHATNEVLQISPHAPTCSNTLTRQDDANAANKGICMPLHAQAVMDIQLDVANAENKDKLVKPSEHKNVDDSKLNRAPLKRKRSKFKVSTRALICAAKKDMEHAVPLEEAANIQVQLHTSEEIIAKVEKAAVKAHKKILAEGKAVLVREVVQESLCSLGYMSLESLGICMYDVPYLHKLIKLEWKLNMLIACHMAVRKITTLHDLREEILSVENVRSFDELELGPLSLQPLVFRYFAPPKGSAICKITAMDVLNHLRMYLNKYASTSNAKDFISYMVKSRCLPSAPHLCVRIKKFRLYACYILREKKMSIKSTTYKQDISPCEEIATIESERTNVKKQSAVRNAQEVNIARRSKSCRDKVVEGSMHTIYISSGEEDAKESISRKLAGKRSNALTSEQPHSISCRYPSATEERLRLLSKIPLQGNEELQEYSVPARELKAFISTWRDICLSYPIDEVLTQLYKSEARRHTLQSGQKNIMRMKKLLKFFKLHPAVEILNVVVLLMKSGHCNSFLDTYEENLNKKGETTENDDRRTVLENTADQNALSEHDTFEGEPAKSLEQVLEEIIGSLGDIIAGTVFSCREQVIINEQNLCTMVKRFMNLEKVLVNRWSIKSFSDLKLGSFLDFMDVHQIRIEKECSELFKNMARKMLYGNGVSEKRVQRFLSQVKSAVADGDCLPHHEFVMQLFAKQFSLHHMSDWCSSIVQDITDCLKGEDPGCSCVFSTALLATKANSTPVSQMKCNRLAQNSDLVEAFSIPRVGILGVVTNADAKRCLAKAPMLCDLLKWSQWDSVFSPVLGSFSNWLEKESPIEGLICLATSDKKYLRIDGSATVDTFMAAMAQGCGEQAALQFVSVLAVYGGVDRVPQSLLKSYSLRALEIFMGDPLIVGQVNRGVSGYENHQAIKACEGEISSLKSDPLQAWGYDEICKKQYTGVIKLVFDLLANLPSEFVVLAASIVVPALSKIVPSATAAMLNSCSSVDHLMSLHEIGLSLGIIDWVSNFQSLFLPTHAASMETSTRVSVPQEHTEESMRQVSCEDQPSPLSQNIKCEVQKNDTATTGGDSGVQDQETEIEKEAREVIEAIWKEEFGMDLSFSSKESDLVAKQHVRIGRALLSFSEELCSHDTHFFLQLVRNADVNQYAYGVKPTLVLILESQRVVVVNNELGFTAADMRALCNAGSLTKFCSLAGYRGVAFKSVFCVSDAPEVHSRGFHVKFDISKRNTGFFLPTTIPPFTDWDVIEVVLAAANVFKEQKLSTWNTCLLLPLKHSVQDGPDIQMLSTKLNDIQPSLLLFLHQMESIMVKNDLMGTLRVLQRCNLDDGLVKISDGINSAIWLVVKQQLTAFVECPGVQTTELALAFPLREVSVGVYEACNEHQHVFAFLPLRSYGLRFIIQGSFSLASSLEELDVNSTWNLWLLSAVPNVFMEAVEALKKLACFKHSSGKAASCFLSFIPLEGEVQSFFSSLPRMILARLRASQCLPVEAREGEWALPCILLGGWTESCKSLITDQLLQEHLGLYYLHRDVVINPAVAYGIGIHMYGSRMLVNLMESVCFKKGSLQDLGPRWIGSWFVALKKCMIREAEDATYFCQPRFEPEDMETLKRIACIPLSDGTYTSLEEGTVWLPFSDTGGADDDEAILLKDFPLIYPDLRTVDASMLVPWDFEVDSSNSTTCAMVEKGESKNLILSMLQGLGVHKIWGHELMDKHILLSMASDEFLERPKPVVVQYLAFVMVHLQSNCEQCVVNRSSILAQLKRDAVIATKDGPKRLKGEFLHFGVEFDCKIEVKQILEGLHLGWTEIDPAYLELIKERASLSQWRQFFKDLGVADFVRLVRKRKNQLNSSKGKVNVTVKDWECPELVAILECFCILDQNYPDKDSQLCRLLSIFDLLWDKCYSKRSAISRSDGGIKKKPRNTSISSFVSQMRSFAWVQSAFDLKLYQPNQLYYRCPAVESILGTHAPYPVPQISSITFAEALGLKVNVSISDVLDLLKVWNQRPFKATVSQMTQLYNFMWNGAALHKEDIVAFLKHEACIFVPTKMKAKVDALSKGRFYPSSCLFWEDCTGSIAKLLQTKDASPDVSAFRICPKALNTLYPTLRGFLVDICHVQATLGFYDYFTVLKVLANYFSPQDVLPEVLAIFEIWSHDIDTSHVKTSDVCKWKELLQKKESRVLPTLQDKWVSLDDSEGLVCWCNDAVLQEQCSDIKNIFYVCVNSISLDKADTGNASRQAEKLVPFFKAMGIPPLSQVVKQEPIVHGARWSKKMFDMLHWSLPYTQRYMQKWHGDVYNNVLKLAFATRLKKIQCVCADELFVHYKLPGRIGSGQKQFKIEYLFQGDTFYATNLEDLNSLYLEFSRIFFDGAPNFQLANFLHLITLSSQSGSTESELEALLASHGIVPLSKDEKRWSFDCRSVDGEQKPLDSGLVPRHFRVPDDMFKQGITNHTLPSWPWHQTRKKMVYERQFPTSDRVAALQKSLDAVMHQIEAKKKERQVDGKRQDTSPLPKSRGLVAPGKTGSKRKDAPTMFEEAMVPLEKKFRSSKDAMDARIRSACHRVNASKEFAFNDHNIQRPFVDSNPITGLHKADATNGYKLQKELAAGNVAWMPEDAHFLNLSNQEQTYFGHQSEQQVVLTGRLGEALVYNHLMEKYKTGCVRWINAEAECGLPYDIVVDGIFNQQLLVEVKSTCLAHQNCFEISNHEWEFAAQAGERFVIIRVFLDGTKGSARFVWLPNPVKLCQKGTINLALVVPQHHPIGPDGCH